MGRAKCCFLTARERFHFSGNLVYQDLRHPQAKARQPSAVLPINRITLRLLSKLDRRGLPCSIDDGGRRILWPVQPHHGNELRFRGGQPISFFGLAR